MIGIVDYGVGNLMSVYKAFISLNMEAKIVSTKEEIQSCDAIVLPGVGAYKDAMDNLCNAGLIEVIKEYAKSGKYILGICLGMQLLFDKSFEDGEWDGLGLISGRVVKFTNKQLKIPHMGWNSLIKNREDGLIKDIKDGDYVYFVHSYYLVPQNFSDVVLYAEYDVKVPAVVRVGNIIGMQFHPEKSSETGLQLLRNFGELLK